MRGDVDMVTGPEVANIGFVRKAQAGFALQQHNPFGVFLVVLEIRRAGLAGGDDALDA